MTNDKAKHMAVMNVLLEVHEVDEQGRCSGKIVSSEELSQAGLKPKFLLTVTGFDKFECLKKLKERIREIQSE
jgi:hypothetical protein